MGGVRNDTMPFEALESRSDSDETATHRLRRLDSLASSADDGSIVGQLIDEQYLVQRVLGRGGMGTVYEARHARLDLPVALKIIRREYLARPTAAKRFAREAAALAAVR